MKLTQYQLTVVLDALDQRVKGCGETLRDLDGMEQTEQVKRLRLTFETIRDRADKLATRIEEYQG